MNKYLCIGFGKKVEVEAATSYEAQQKALPVFQGMFPRKKIKGWQFSVHLVQKEGGEVVIPSTLF